MSCEEQKCHAKKKKREKKASNIAIESNVTN